MTDRPQLKGPLKGIRILDLTRLLPGPLATQYLADLGAEVIKIEDIDFPDYTRFFPPQIGNQSVHYLSVNRSKKSLALKLKDEEGQAIFFDLVKTAHLVLDGFRPGRLDKMGIGYQAAAAVNPAINYVAITGYGQDGPLSDKAGHDLNYIGYAGVQALTGENGRMVMPGVQIADIMGGSYNAIIACMSALFETQRTGKGQQVDVSMTDGAMQMVSLPLGEYMNTGTNYKAGQFMLSGGLANYHIYPCKDGKFMALGALEPKFWISFCQMIGKPEWMNLAIPVPDQVNRLKEELTSLFLSRTRNEWAEIADRSDVCLSPVIELDELEQHPNVVARKMIVKHKHSDYGEVKSVNQPLKFSGSGLHEGWAPPVLGENSAEILESAGYDNSRIQSLIERGIILQP